MKKKIAAFSLGFVVLIGIWYGESRKFFCLADGKCITVWKTYHNVCFIVLGKYYSPMKPSKNYIESTNTNGLTIFFTDELPNTLIFSSEQKVTVHNDDKRQYVFYDYDLNKKKFHQILYKTNSKKFSDLKANAELMELYIQENYATNTKGKNL